MVYDNSTAIPREELSAVLVQGRGINESNIGLQVLPAYGVNRRSAHLVQLTIAAAELLRIMDKIVEPGGDIERITMTFGDATVTLAIRKEEVQIPDEVELDYADYFSVEALGSQIGEDKLELTHEYLVANAIFNTTNFGSATNSAVAYTNANLATISLVADIYAAIEAVRQKGEEPNAVIIPSLVYQRVRQATLVVNFVRGYLQAQFEVTANTLQKAFADEGIEYVLVGRSRYNAAAKGATPSFTKIWPNTYIWVGRISPSFSAEDNGIETISGVGATLYWEPYGGLFQVETYRHEPQESNIVRAKTSGVPYIANPNAGTLIATQYS
jgi:hypothetical protein